MSAQEIAGESRVELLTRQNQLQQQLIEAQQEIIRLHEQIQRMTPTLPGEDAHWHRVSGGMTSEDTLKTADPDQIRALFNWLLSFGGKYIRPYVHLEVYSELTSQMTRGISRQLAELETMRDLGMSPEDFDVTVGIDTVKKRVRRRSAKPKQPKTEAAAPTADESEPQQPSLID